MSTLISHVENDLRKMNLDDQDLADLDRIFEKITNQAGRRFSDMSEDDLIDIQCEPSQYVEEFMEVIASHLWRQRLFRS